jgi:pilus assembly protein Flp/PilA
MRLRCRSVLLFLRDDSGQDLIEYALLSGLIGLAAVASLHALAARLSAVFLGIPQKVMAAMYS